MRKIKGAHQCPFLFLAIPGRVTMGDALFLFDFRYDCQLAVSNLVSVQCTHLC